MNNKNLLTYASVLSVITTLCIIFVLLPSEEVQTSTLKFLGLLRAGGVVTVVLDLRISFGNKQVMKPFLFF